jgi:hypothetical protein
MKHNKKNSKHVNQNTIKNLTGLGIFSLLILSIFLVSCQTTPKNPETITVAGHAEMTVAPDRAKVYTGISILRPTAAEAQAEANKVITAIVVGLKNKGIAESDIETENLNLNEEKEWNQNESQMISVGWRATQTLKIQTTDLRKVGDIVDVAVQNGANQINSIEFTLSTAQDDASKQAVLAQATQIAKKKGQTMADTLGVKLDKIVSASESNYAITPYRYMMTNSVGMDAVSESAKVLPSDVMVSADMTLIYAIKQG